MAPARAGALQVERHGEAHRCAGPHHHRHLQKRRGADGGIEDLNKRFALGQGLIALRIVRQIWKFEPGIATNHFAPRRCVSESVFQFELALQKLVNAADDV